MHNKKLDTIEAAEYFKMKPNTLEVWRSKKKGPKYSKIGGRVLYDLESLNEYFNAHNIHTKDTSPKLVK